MLAMLLGTMVLMSCKSNYGVSKENIEQGNYMTYYYDSVHDVGIWHSQNGYGEAMFVLPASVFKNKELPMK